MIENLKSKNYYKKLPINFNSTILHNIIFNL